MLVSSVLSFFIIHFKVKVIQNFNLSNFLVSLLGLTTILFTLTFLFYRKVLCMVSLRQMIKYRLTLNCLLEMLLFPAVITLKLFLSLLDPVYKILLHVKPQFNFSLVQYVCFNLNLRKPLNERRTVVSRKLKGFDFDAFNEMIGSSGLSDGCILQSVESLAKEYDEVLCKALDKLAPKRTRIIVIRPNAPWYNEEIATQKRKRRRLERKWRSTGLKTDRVNYLEQCNVVNDMLYKAKEQHYSAVIQENAHDSKLLFRTVDKLLQRSIDKRYLSVNSDH